MKADEKAVIDYYNRSESKRGYFLFLKGTKHFGYYKSGDKPWQFDKALRQMEAFLGQKLNLPDGSTVLDAGCGMGDVASYLATNNKLKIEGIDILDFNITEAKRRISERGLSKNIHVQLMSYAQMSLQASKFDGAYTMETFVHASDPAKVLNEFYRILKPGGKLVMFEYSKDPDTKMPEKAAQQFAEMNKMAAMPAFQQFDHGVLESYMKKAGFEDITVEDITQHMMPMVKVFAYVAFIPYKILTVLGLHRKAANAMSALVLWRYKGHFRYNVYTAVKSKR
ncbi:MAG TPA: methyltransferase domain-containing protein [Candidatus Saccharimonadales bacterium]